MIKLNVELTMDHNGKIWANDLESGQCVLRIQGVDQNQIDIFGRQGIMIDLRMDDSEPRYLIAKDDNETQKAHEFLVNHILYAGHQVKIMTRLLVKTLTCDCGKSIRIQMKDAPEGY